MEAVNLKKGLFGYTQSSVQEYIEALNSEVTERTNKLMLENEELKKKCSCYEAEIDAAIAKQEELRGEISTLCEEKKALNDGAEKLKEQINELKEQLDEALADRFDYEQGQNELADVMLEAKRFANDLKHKTELEFEQKKAANDDRIKKEKQRIEKYISDVDELIEVLHRLCDNLSREAGVKRAELGVVIKNLTALGSK